MVIETEGLTKYYDKKLGCRDITVSVGKGEIFGLLGPNGAGKSTFIKMLVGLIFPTAGTASVLGKPVGDTAVRARMGYLPENFKYQDWMTGEDLLSFHASLYKLGKSDKSSRIDEVLELVKLKGHEKYRVGTYSKGMQQRIGLACALLPDPELLFLDEPTSALDPIGRKEVREIMLDLKDRGKTVLLNSHLLGEVETVCDSIAIIKKGSIIRKGKLDEILESKTVLEANTSGLDAEILEKLKRLDPRLSYKNNTVQMTVVNKDQIHSVASMIIESGAKLHGLIPHRESLESVFISLVEGSDSH